MQNVCQRESQHQVRTRIAWLIGLAAMSVCTDRLQAQEWWQRTVTSVSGAFEDINPKFGFENGVGTPRLAWGDPGEDSFQSSLEFLGYDRFPEQDQPWFFPGQTVQPGQAFEAGKLRFRNGTVATASSARELRVELSASVFGGEFYIDNHPLIVHDTWRIMVRQTPNVEGDPEASADYIFFPDFPHLGSLRVLEERTATARMMVKFGSLIPDSIAELEDPSAGFWSPSVIDDPDAAGVPAPLLVSIEAPDLVDLRTDVTLPVLLYGSQLFDVGDVLLETLRLGDTATGPSAAPRVTAIDDANGDSFADLAIEFDVPELVAVNALKTHSKRLFLRGGLDSGIALSGVNAVRVVPEPCGMALLGLGMSPWLFGLLRARRRQSPRKRRLRRLAGW